MTVIATLITSACTVHASDSLLTTVQTDGSIRFMEWKQTKIVQVRPWRGAIAYYGMAGWKKGWRTLTWLQEKAAHLGIRGQPKACQAPV